MTVKSRHKWHCQLFCKDYRLLTVTFKVQSLLHLKELSYPLANGNNSFNLHWKYSQGMEWCVHDPGGIGPPSRPCPPFDSLMRVLLSFHLGWLTKKKKKDIPEKFSYLFSQIPSSGWLGLNINFLIPEAEEQEAHISLILYHFHAPFTFPSPCLSPPQGHVCLWQAAKHGFLICFNDGGCLCFHCSASWLLKILAFQDPRSLPLTPSPGYICRAKILETAPTIINVLNRCPKMTKCIISAAGENAEGKQEQK